MPQLERRERKEWREAKDRKAAKWPFFRFGAEENRPDDPRSVLEDSLEETRVLLAQAYAGFNFASDQELVESYVYEIQALKTRYSYLLRQRKTLEQTGQTNLAV